jgi:hypothetical protein
LCRPSLVMLSLRVNAGNRFHGFGIAQEEMTHARLYWGNVGFITRLAYLLGEHKKYPANVISNAKYNAITFVPVVLYEEVSSS